MKRKKTKQKKHLTAETEKEIFHAFNSGMKRSQIKKLYRIDDTQFQHIVRIGILKEGNSAESKKKWKWVGQKNGGFIEIK